MEPIRKIPLGVEDYKTVSRDCYYVDKTMLAKEVASLPDGSVTLFTRPRRFGKSLAISMLSAFFDCKDAEAKTYFQGMKIEKEREFALCGTSPVASFSFKDIQAKKSEEVLRQTTALIRNEYSRHNELLNSSAINEDDRNYYRSFIDSNMDDIDPTDALYRLTSMLEKHYGQRCYLFIDEYDTPIQNSRERGFYDEVIGFFRLLYGKALKGNSHLKAAVLTGVLRIAKESLFSGLNNLIVDNGYDSAFPEFFGFTKEEARALVEYFNASHSFEDLWDWYGGYCFGGEEIMNPWSILSYFRFQNSLKEYWTNTSTVSVLSEISQESYTSCSDLLKRLLNGETVEMKPNFVVSYADSLDSSERLVGFLIATGYLSVDVENKQRIIIPNNETRIALREEVLKRYRFENESFSVLDARQAIESGDAERFSLIIKKVLLHSFSFFDFQQERSYQAMVLTLVSILFEDCIVKSEVNTGQGRCDIMIQPRIAGKFGAVIEIKFIKAKTSQQRIEERASVALKQIKDKEYAEDLILLGANPIYAYGIAFFDRKVAIKVEALNSK